MRGLRGLAVGVEGRLALLQLLLGGASFAAETLAEVLVIGSLGPGWMPVGLAGAAILSLGLTTVLARRPVGLRRLPALAGAAVVVGLVVWSGLFWLPTATALVFLLVTRPLRDALMVAFGNLIATRYDPQAAKRALPRLAAAGQVGAIIAGLTLPVLLRLGGPPAAVVVWPALVGAAMVLAWRLPLILTDGGAARSAGVVGAAGASSAAGAAGVAASSAQSAGVLRRSPLLWTLAIAAVLAVATSATLGLVSAMLLSAAVPNRTQLASLYSLIGACSSFAVLVVQLVGLPVLLRRLGTARAALLPPALAVFVAGWAITGGGLAAGVAAQAGRLTIRPALQTPVEDILLNLLPLRERAPGRAWLRGWAVPLSGLVSSLCLAALAALGAGPQVVAGVALLTASGGLAAAFALRRQHRQASLALARGGDLLAGRLALPAFGGVDAAVTEEIARRLETSERDDERQLLVALLADLDPVAATSATVARLPDASPALTVGMLTVLAERRCAAAELLPEVPRLLASPDPAVRRATLAALATTPELPTALVVPLLDDPHPEVALSAVQRLLGRDGHGEAAGERARDRLRILTTDGSAAVRATTAPLVAQADPDALVPLLGDPSAAVRRAAALAASAVPSPSDALAAALIAAAGDRASAVRVAAVTALARLAATAVPTLFAALDDPMPHVRAAAATTLQEGGIARAGGMSMARQLPADQGWARVAALAVLARAAPWRWRGTLLTEEEASLAALARLMAARATLGAARGPVGTLLRRDVDDEIAEGTARLGESLTITDGAAVARTILDGLAAADRIVRAQAQEALEAVRSPRLARRAVALFAPAPLPATNGVNGDPTAPMLAEAVAALTAGDAPWRHLLLAAAADEEPGLRTAYTVMNAQDGKDGTMLSLVERATLLRGVPPFADLASEQLRLLAGLAEEIEVGAGKTLFAAGAEGDHLYVVVAGQVALEEQRGVSGSIARISTLEAGAALGEDAVFDGGTHVLNATALTDCQLLALGRTDLMALLDEQPALARTLIAWLSARLRETTGKLAERTKSRPRSVIDLLDQMGDRPAGNTPRRGGTRD